VRLYVCLFFFYLSFLFTLLCALLMTMTGMAAATTTTQACRYRSSRNDDAGLPQQQQELRRRPVANRRCHRSPPSSPTTIIHHHHCHRRPHRQCNKGDGRRPQNVLHSYLLVLLHLLAIANDDIDDELPKQLQTATTTTPSCRDDNINNTKDKELPPL
jgi:hypothetical protein